MKNIGTFQFSVPWFVLFIICKPVIELAQSLECTYCPEFSTVEECTEMNMTQICINETKCGYARFIQKRKDLGQLYPENSTTKEITSVTIKKGCMNEDYCTKIEEKKGGTINSSECIFCEDNLCDLQFPILCVECDEKVDKYCAIQTEPIIECPPGESCYRQRIQEENYTYKRGCMASSRCLKKDFCEYCSTDVCWTAPVISPAEQRQEMAKKENHTVRSPSTRSGKGYRSRSDSNYLKFNLGLMFVMVFTLCFYF